MHRRVDRYFYCIFRIKIWFYSRHLSATWNENGLDKMRIDWISVCACAYANVEQSRQIDQIEEPFFSHMWWRRRLNIVTYRYFVRKISTSLNRHFQKPVDRLINFVCFCRSNMLFFSFFSRTLSIATSKWKTAHSIQTKDTKSTLHWIVMQPSRLFSQISVDLISFFGLVWFAHRIRYFFSSRF